MVFEFATAGRIIFGPGTLKQIGSLAKEIGERALVVIGRSLSRTENLLDLLSRKEIKSFVFHVPGEPTIDWIRDGVHQARESKCDLILGYGGGSVLDAGKAIAALAANEGEVEDYIEIIGRSLPLTLPSKPYIAIPTTAGTGAEVTRNAVITSIVHRVKVSLRSPMMIPRLALIDPELTYPLPPEITAGTGLDALTQLIEPFVSLKANPLTDAICRQGIQKVACSLRRAYEEADNEIARQDMALASLFGGLALANAGLGAVHGLAAPIGGMFPAPHGQVCARLLPLVMAVNIRALQDRFPDSPALKVYEEIARLLTRKDRARPIDAVHWIQEISQYFGIPSLSRYGVTLEAVPDLIQRGAAASSMKGNPIELSPDEMKEILLKAME